MCILVIVVVVGGSGGGGVAPWVGKLLVLVVLVTVMMARIRHEEMETAIDFLAGDGVAT